MENVSRRRFLSGSVAALGGVAALGTGPAWASRDGSPREESACATLTDHGMTASVVVTAPARARIEAWPVDEPAAKLRSAWRPTNGAGVAQISLAGAALPGGAWAWRSVIDGGTGGADVVGPAHRIPARPAPGKASAFTFAFGSCILQKHPVPALNVARSANPVFFAMLGDLGYQDDPVFHPYAQTYDRYVTLFRRILRRRDVDRLIGAMPLFAVQDDHDYGQDDAWRDTVKPYAAQAYADVIPGARWPGSDYRRWSVGQADFFLTDNRRYRDPPNPPFENGAYRSVLGSEQRRWLVDGLASSNAAVKVVFIPMTMTWYWSDGERADVLASIADRVSGTVVFCSGDKHAGAFVQHADRVWELMASPLENPTKHKTSAKPGVVWTENGTGPALWNVVGLVDVDTASTNTVTLRLLREDGEELHREVVPIS